ncbi:MAG: DNA-3-methyladenine glycosylase [Candidatus Obscuribacterales bacterium]|nr:DNA-3-methyladenine glycosylase [Candidatus Obscuribacterales bacterium]
MTKVYSQNFFSRPTLAVAPELLGTILCRKLPDGTILHAPIVEVEAYTQDDPACHAAKGLTKRCEVMFGPAGYAYVYFIYGMYHCLNVVTEANGVAGAVLIRAIGTKGGEGPGKLCRHWQISSIHNGTNLMATESDLWIAKGHKLLASEIGISPRIGISKAQERMWRFFIKSNQYLSLKEKRSTKTQ